MIAVDTKLNQASEYSHGEVVRKVCEQQGWKFEEIDPYTGLIGRISNDTKSLLWKSGTYPGNEATSVGIANDKGYTGNILKSAGINVPDGDYFFVVPEYREFRPDGKEITDALVCANTMGYPVFVKPINGRAGQNAGVVSNDLELLHRLIEIGRRSHGTMVQKVVSGKEHRVYWADGEIGFTYRKIPAEIVGDGSSTVSQLIEQMNTSMIVSIAEGNEFAANALAESGYNLQDTLPTGQKVVLSASANLNVGVLIDDFRSQAPEAVIEWTRKISKATGLSVLGIDLFAPNSIDDDPEDFTVLEVNASPMLKVAWALGYRERVEEIWRRIISKNLK